MTADEVADRTKGKAGGCSLVILHESEEALEHARSLCERIMQEMWTELDIDVRQWPFASLSGQDISAEVASKSARAEVVVVAAAGEGEFATEFIEWTERLVALRQKREGALVGLFTPGTGKKGGRTLRDVHLHRVALRAGMDYLNHLPQTPSSGIPDVTGWCASRAETITGTLDQIISADPNLPRA